jgi:hypothetical protein
MAPRPPRLPNWAAWEGDTTIVVDLDGAYPHYLEALAPQLGETITQYALEVARRCLTVDLKAIVKAADPAREKALNLRLIGKQWKLKNFPPGDGELRGGSEFKRYHDNLPGEPGARRG